MISECVNLPHIAPPTAEEDSLNVRFVVVFFFSLKYQWLGIGSPHEYPIP